VTSQAVNLSPGCNLYTLTSDPVSHLTCTAHPEVSMTNITPIVEATADANACHQRAKDYAVWCQNSAGTYTYGEWYVPNTLPILIYIAPAQGCSIYQNTCTRSPSEGGVLLYDFVNGSNTNAAACAQRARDYALYCGNSPGYVRESESVYWPSPYAVNGIAPVYTYAQPPGCMIKQDACAANAAYAGTFLDTDAASQSDPNRCVQRATDWANYCKNPPGTTTSTSTYYNFDGSTSPVTTVHAPGCTIEQGVCAATPTAIGIFTDPDPASFADPARCAARAAEWAVACGNPAGASTTAAYHALAGDVTRTTAWTAGCAVSQACAAKPEYAGTFTDTDVAAQTDASACAARAHVWATTCGNLPGTSSTTTFYTPAGPADVTRAAAPGCRIDVSICPNKTMTPGAFADSAGAGSLTACLERLIANASSCGDTPGADVGAFYVSADGTTAQAIGAVAPGCLVSQPVCKDDPLHKGSFAEPAGAASGDACMLRAQADAIACHNAAGTATQGTYFSPSGEPPTNFTIVACADDGACAADEHCFGGVCRAKLAAGKACSASGECGAGFCVDGVCCDRACDGQCEACDLPDHPGSCGAAPRGAPQGGRAPCAGAGACAGQCDGASSMACVLPGAEVACGMDTCAGGMANSFRCDGRGACAETSQTCSVLGCDGARCKMSCAADADCGAAMACVAGGCRAGDAASGTDGHEGATEGGGSPAGVADGDGGAGAEVGRGGGCAMSGRPRGGRGDMRGALGVLAALALGRRRRRGHARWHAPNLPTN
jgi:hypothetical protein